jgi:hypothetical protein
MSFELFSIEDYIKLNKYYVFEPDQLRELRLTMYLHACN